MLYVSARTWQYLLVHYFRWRDTWLPSGGHSHFNIIHVIPIVSIPYLPRTKNVEYNSISIPYFRFLNKHLIKSIPFLICPESGIRNRIQVIFLIPYSLFDRIVSIHYLPQMRNKEKNSTSIPCYLFLIWSNRFYPWFVQIRNKE